jgi:hypothetical protein
MNTTFTFDVGKVAKNFDDIQKKQIPFAVAVTFRRMAFKTKKHLEDKMDETFDGGATRWTRSSVKYKGGTKFDPTAYVYVDLEKAPYLKTMIDGGTVRPLGTNKRLHQPVNIRKNKYGNVTYTRGMSTIAKKLNSNPAFFVGRPKSKGKEMPLGLWRRYKRKGPKLILSLDKTSRSQKKLFPAYELSRSFVKRNIRQEFDMQFKKAFANRK